MLTYLFWPNPEAPSYSDPKVAAVLGLCLLLVIGSFVFKRWRAAQQNPVTKRLTKSWAGAMLTFGLVGLFLTICRVEGISYLSMRFLWVVWMIALAVVAVLQYKLFRMRHYEVVPHEQRVEDPNEKYLPKKKRT